MFDLTSRVILNYIPSLINDKTYDIISIMGVFIIKMKVLISFRLFIRWLICLLAYFTTIT